MNKSHLLGAVCACVITLGISTSANASLVSRLGGQAVYDTDLNITWLADANAGAGSAYDDGDSSTDGWMTKNSALAWADQLIVGDHSEWRLPSTPYIDPSCSRQQSDRSDQYGCINNEMGHLYYVELGVAAGDSILSSSNPDLNLFVNIQAPASHNYWFGTPGIGGDHFNFSFFNGTQNYGIEFNQFSAWAVADGDVFVPIPASVWLFGSGLLGLIGLTRR